MNQETKEAAERKIPEEIVIQSADELMAMLQGTLNCRFVYRGKWVNIPVTPRSAATTEKVRELHRKALPPFKRERGPNGGLDELDPKYLKDREDNFKRARSLTIYAHCPMVSAKKPGLVDIEEIHKFVQGLFTELILEIIVATIEGGGVSTDMESRVDFTLAGGLEP